MNQPRYLDISVWSRHNLFTRIVYYSVTEYSQCVTVELDHIRALGLDRYIKHSNTAISI